MSLSAIKKVIPKIYLTLFLASMLSPNLIWSQHNGNPLFFQGLTDPNSVSVKGSAYGNAFTSRGGDINSLFYNAAGLANIESFQFSVAANLINYLERDNQYFYPGNEYLNWSLYMEGLLIPDPAWNGIWSDSLGIISYDSLGNPVGLYWDPDQIKWPVMSEDDYSKEADDHEETSSSLNLSHISLAYPFKFSGKSFVAALSYYRQYNINDYDWNGAHLDPHWGTSDIIPGTEGDTTRTNWSVFTRSRTAGIYSITAALAFQLNQNLQFGLRLNRSSGDSNDEQTLNRIGYFLAKHQLNDWAFSYDEHRSVTTGTSSFSSTSVNFGALFISENVNFGFNIQLPSTIEREWTYSTEVRNGVGTTYYDSSGVDRVNMPATYTIGITLKPVEDLALSLDYETTRFDKAEFEQDKNHRDSLTIYTRWVNQTALRFGIEYRINELINISAGYQSQTIPFIPYGAAIRDKGPAGENFSVGVSVNILHGTLDLAYTNYQLKYYDAYMTNRNFTLECYNRFALGYTFKL